MFTLLKQRLGVSGAARHMVDALAPATGRFRLRSCTRPAPTPKLRVLSMAVQWPFWFAAKSKAIHPTFS
jgi:hypothetical protein